MNVELNNPPTYREMSDLFELMRMMNPVDLQKCADDIIGYASDAEVAAEHWRRQEPQNDYERWAGVVTYRE